MAKTVKQLIENLLELPQNAQVYFEDMEGVCEPVHSVEVRKRCETKNGSFSPFFELVFLKGMSK